MTRKTVTILVIAIGLLSCNSKRTHLNDLKLAQIRHVIEKSGLVRLPLAFDEWFKTIDMLTYDKSGRLKGFIYLAAHGGDANYAFDSNGYFDKNVYCSADVSKDIEDEYDEAKYVNCIRTDQERQ